MNTSINNNIKLRKLHIIIYMQNTHTTLFLLAALEDIAPVILPQNYQLIKGKDKIRELFCQITENLVMALPFMKKYYVQRLLVVNHLNLTAGYLNRSLLGIIFLIKSINILYFCLRVFQTTSQ